MALTKHDRRVVRITPVLTTAQYADNDILFGTTEIPNAVSGTGECSRLVSAMFISKDSEVFDGELFFAQTNQAVGTTNAARNVSDADFLACKVTGTLTLDGSADDYVYGGGRISRFDVNLEGAGATDGDLIAKARFPILLQAEPDSTSVFCFMFLSGTDVTPTFAVGDLELVLGIEY